MQVLVTGGSGRLGQYAIADLLTHGHEVINADRRAIAPELALTQTATSARFVETDLSDVGQVMGVLRGCDAVVHLGAIPSPNRHADEVVFRNNVLATFTVLQAAALLGVQRAAFASSVSAYGMAYSKHNVAQLFAPLDESHPFLASDPYALSKEADERTGEMFHRQTGMSVAALRFHWVARAEELAKLGPEGWREPGRTPTNLWGYIEARDAGAACRAAIEATGFGFGAFNITAADTLCTAPTEQLIREHLPTTDLRAPIPGTGSGFAIDKAKRILSWEPKYSWRDRSS